MYIIVDTSVWIEFFHGRLDEDQKIFLTDLIENEQAVLTDIIKHELLVGTNTTAEYNSLCDDLSALQEISIQAPLKDEFNRFGFELKKNGLLGKYTDTSIAFLSKLNGYPVFSFDKYFSKLAEKKLIPKLEL